MAKSSLSSDLKRMKARTQGIPESFAGAAKGVIDSTTNAAADQMRVFIATRGTGWEGHEGRVDTGFMLENVVSHPADRTSNTVSGWYGFGAREPYFAYQENGFRIWNSDHEVPPMHALLDSFVAAREKFLSAMEGLVK